MGLEEPQWTRSWQHPVATAPGSVVFGLVGNLTNRESDKLKLYRTFNRSLLSNLVTAEELAKQVRLELGPAWLPGIYRDRILKTRTRSYDFETSQPSARVEIHHTLLGIELKIGKRRLLCPDLATARYLAVFARAGCDAVAVPYNITKVSQLADELESAWHRMLLLADQKAEGKSAALRTRIRGLLVATVRKEIGDFGVGARIPEFNKSTKQRRSKPF